MPWANATRATRRGAPACRPPRWWRGRGHGARGCGRPALALTSPCDTDPRLEGRLTAQDTVRLSTLGVRRLRHRDPPDQLQNGATAKTGNHRRDACSALGCACCPGARARHSPTLHPSRSFARRGRLVTSARRAAPRRRSAPAQEVRRDGQTHLRSTHGDSVHQEGSPAGLG
jgi:hypothetical protein